MQRYGSEKAGIPATKFGRASAVRTAAITQAMGRTVPTVIVRGAHPLTHHGSGAINSPYNPLACGASITVHRALTLSAMPVYQGSALWHNEVRALRDVHGRRPYRGTDKPSGIDTTDRKPLPAYVLERRSSAAWLRTYTIYIVGL